MFKAIKKYLAKPPSNKTAETVSFFDLAKKHITKSKGSKENIVLNIDKILYGKQ